MVPYYYPRVTERVSTAIIDLFNDVKINRFNEDGTVDKIIHVPIVFHANKNFTEFLMNTSRVKESRHPTPIMGLRISGYSRDNSRTTQSHYIRTVFSDEKQTYIRDLRPAPWKIGFTLSIYTENLIDFSQILENIVTYFNPTITVAIKEFENINIERDVVVTLQDTSIEMNDEVDRDGYQTYTIDLTLSAACVLYPPASIATIINQINQNIAIQNRNIAQIQNEGIEPMTISEYNKKINEIVDLGLYPDSIIVSRIVSKTDNDISIVLPVEGDSETALALVPGGSTIVYVSVEIISRFNSFNTTISVGTDANNNLIMPSSENTPSFIAKYAQSLDIKINEDTQFNIYYNRSSAVEGLAVVTIAWN